MRYINIWNNDHLFLCVQVSDVALMEEDSSIIISTANGLVRLTLIGQNNEEKKQDGHEQTEIDFEGIGKLSL